MSAAAKRLRRKRRIARGPRQRPVQLGGSQRQDPDQRQDMLHAHWAASASLGRRGAILLEMAPQILKRIGPAIALIGDVGLQHRQQARLAVIGDVLEHAGQRRAVREVRHLGEIQAHLEFRIHARRAAGDSP